MTLKIALWALHWSFQKTVCELPVWYKPSFESYFRPKSYTGVNGFYCIVWIALIGADSDTYGRVFIVVHILGASAGPILGAYHPQLKNMEVWSKDLRLKTKTEEIVDAIIASKTK